MAKGTSLDDVFNTAFTPHGAFFNFSWLILTSFLLVSGGLFPITNDEAFVAGCHSNQQ